MLAEYPVDTLLSKVFTERFSKKNLKCPLLPPSAVDMSDNHSAQSFTSLLFPFFPILFSLLMHSFPHLEAGIWCWGQFAQGLKPERNRSRFSVEGAEEFNYL